MGESGLDSSFRKHRKHVHDSTRHQRTPSPPLCENTDNIRKVLYNIRLTYTIRAQTSTRTTPMSPILVISPQRQRQNQGPLAAHKKSSSPKNTHTPSHTAPSLSHVPHYSPGRSISSITGVNHPSLSATPHLQCKILLLSTLPRPQIPRKSPSSRSSRLESALSTHASLIQYGSSPGPHGNSSAGPKSTSTSASGEPAP